MRITSILSLSMLPVFAHCATALVDTYAAGPSRVAAAPISPSIRLTIDRLAMSFSDQMDQRLSEPVIGKPMSVGMDTYTPSMYTATHDAGTVAEIITSMINNRVCTNFERMEGHSKSAFGVSATSVPALGVYHFVASFKKPSGEESRVLILLSLKGDAGR